MRTIKWVSAIFLFLILTKTGIAQQLRLGDNPSSVEKSALLDLVSTNQGLLLPRITDTTSINALNPPNGMVIYYSPANQILIRTNGSWQGAITANNFKLSNLSDAAVTLPASGQILQFNGTSWINATPAYLTTIDTSNIANFYQKVRGVFTGIAPITINANGQIGITQAGATSDGYLNSSDWNTFNNKQPADNYLTGLTGDISATGPGNVAATIAPNAVTYNKIQNVSATDRVLGRVTAGSGIVEEIPTTGSGNVVRSNGATITNPSGIVKGDIGLGNADNTSDLSKPISTATQAALNLKINLSQKGANNGVATLDGGGKVPISQLAVGAQIYKGTWSAITNTPFISDATGTRGDTYRVVESGTIDLGSGNVTFSASDDVIHNGSIWQRNPATSDVTSVNSQTGTVILTTDHVDEGYINKYYTDARADLKINVTEKAANNGVATLDAGGKVPISQLPLGAQVYKGTWDASSNTPALADGTGTTGWTYRVTTAGTQNLGSGSIAFSVGDDIIYNGTIWQRNPSSSAVTSVNSQTGIVLLTTDHINEGTNNQYYTDARARGSLSAIAPLSYNSTTGYFSIPQASSSVSGYLSTADWIQFNQKQVIGNYITGLTGDVTATGPNNVAATIANNAVTYGKMQAMTANKLLGSGLSGTAVSEITLGVGLSFTGNTLNAATTGGTVTSVSAGNLSPLFTTSVSNPTTTPALSFSLNSQSPNLLFASPTSSSGVPTFRSLVKADLPSTGVYSDQSNTYTSGSKQIFTASNINADIRLTGYAGDPSTLANGDIWYNSATNFFKYRANGTTRIFANLDEAQTFTNKTISGSSNTLTNIGNSSLTNSTIGLTLGTTGTDANVSSSPASLGSSLTLNLPSASATNRGLLTSADWNAFSNKLSTIDTSNISNFYLKVRSLHSTTVPLTYNASTGVIGITQANASTNGYLSSTDWNTFNNKLSTIDTSNISNFYLKVRALNSAGNGISYNSTSGVISNSGVLSVNGNTGALTMDTGFINNFYLKTRGLFSAGSGITYNATTGVISSALNTSNLWSLTGNSGTNPGTNFIGTTDDQDLVFKTNNTETARIISSTGDIKIGSATTGTIRSTKELVLRQDGDTYGPSILRLRNRNAENGAIFETTDPSITLVDFIFKTAANQRNIRYEARAAYGKAGSPSFHIGGASPDNPTLAVGDSYAAFNTNLKIGNYSTPTEALDITGNLRFSGALMPNNSAGTSGYILKSNGNGSAPTWINNTLGNLSDVTIASPSNGQILQYSGSNWVNATASYLTSIDTSNIPNFYLKVRALNSAGTGISYNNNTGVISNSGILSINGNTGAITMDTGYISNFYSKVRSLHTVSAPLTYNSSTGIIGISQANTSTNGYLSSTDWNTFNNKQASGNYISGLTGDVTATGPGSTAATIANNAVTYSKMQAMTANKLLGSGLSGTSVSEITLGTGLSFTGTTLNVSGGFESPLTFSTGLTRTGNSITNNLSTGIAASNQTIIGSTVASGTLTLSSTSNATKGKILFGTSAYDETSNELGIGTTTTQQKLTIGGGAQEAISRDVRTGSLELMGGTSEATGAYFQITGDQNTNSPFEGSAEFVIRNLTNSQYALFSYDGASTWTQRFQLKGLSGDTYLVPNGGKVSIGVTAPTANLHLKAGTATASTAPLKFTAGTNLTTPENGALEYNGSDLFITNGGVRETILTSASGNYLTDPGANGIVARTALNTTTNRTITGTTNKITVTNGDGVSGNPTINAGSDLVDETVSNTYTAGAKQTFVNSATTSGLNLAASADPSTPASGDFWNSTTTANSLKYRDAATATRTLVDLSLSQTLTNKNISGATNTITAIPNSALTNSSITVATGTTGTDVGVSGSPVSLGGTVTLNIPTASGTNTGKLSSTDWTTFNNKVSSNVTTLSSLSSIGTITTGTWNGTTIAIAKGGTGQTTADAAFNALAPSQTGNDGQVLTTDGTNTSWTTVTATNLLGSDVTNSNATANTIADVTGLSFSVTPGNTYKFRFYIAYTAAATTTGSRWSINGPATTFLYYTSQYSLTTTSITNNQGLSTYNVPAASNASSAATGSNIAIIEGIIKPSGSGTVIARFASEVANSAIVAKTGSYVEYKQLN